MARYSGLLGRKVEVLYRAGDVLTPASGTFVADSGRSIFLEQTLLQRGLPKHFRWEIPYRFIVRIDEVPAAPAGAAANSASAPDAMSQTSPLSSGAAAGIPGILPLIEKPKTA